MLSLLATLTALDGATPELSGVGLVLHPEILPTLTDWDGERAPELGTMNCIGGMGFSQTDSFRQGGEGRWCGNGQSGMGWGGAQHGVGSQSGLFTASAYITYGAGWLGVEDAHQELDTVFIFVRPTAVVGVTLGVVSLEVGPYAMFDLPIVTWGKGVDSLTRPFMSAGGQFSLIFGDFVR